MSKKSLYLVDVSSFIFRAYYAIRPLSAPNGTPVNAVYGVITMVSKLIANRKPDHLVICCDSKERNLRLDIYEKYKANRMAPPEDLIPQFELIYEFIKTYPMKVLAKPGYEADDEIATLVKRYKQDPDMDIFVVTQDKDLMQLVDDAHHVCLYDASNDREIHEKEVLEKFGVPPTQVVDVQSLCGDASDNVPGVSGIGPKTATKLIKEYGSVESVLENANLIKGKVGETLAASKEIAMISKKLVLLNDDVPIDEDWDDMTLPLPNVDVLNQFYEKLGFKTLMKELVKIAEPIVVPSAVKKKTTTSLQTDLFGEPESPIADLPQAGAEFILIRDLKQLADVVEEILSKGIAKLAFDTETDSVNAHAAHLVGVSFCHEKQKAYYVPVGHKQAENLDWDSARAILAKILCNPKIAKMAQNAKFDLTVLANHGIDVFPLREDTLIASYLFDSDAQHNLTFLADRYLGYKAVAFTDVVKKGETFADLPVELATRYSAEDAWMTFCLQEVFVNKLSEKGLSKIYYELEVPLVPILAKMEQCGVLVDEDLLNDLKKEFQQKLDLLEIEIYRVAGEQFNINSPKQLGDILFKKLQLPVQKKTKSGYSTDVEVLKTLAPMHELPAYLLEYRSISKLLATYVEQLRGLMDPKTRRVHTSFNQAIVATGRLSSVEPNLQNIPIKTAEGRRIRQVFIAPPGCVLLSADYSQIELRLLAAFSKDPNLIDAYQKDQDIHARTAAHIFGVPIEQVDSTQRMIGKTINFGVTYGQSPFGLSQQLGVPQSESKRFIDGFYQEFSRVRTFKEEVLQEAHQRGYVSTYFGRRRYFPEINSRNKMMVMNSERMAFNTVFQGSAADLIKKAMISIDHKLREKNLQTKMILQVHDELIFEVPHAELEEVKSLVCDIMESAFTLEVPLKVSLYTGKNWAEAH